MRFLSVDKSLQHTIQITFFRHPFGCNGAEPARRGVSYCNQNFSVWTNNRHESGFILASSLEKSSDVRLYFRRSPVFASHALGFLQSVESVVLLLEFGFNSVQTPEDGVVILFVIRAQSTSVHLARGY